MDAVRRLGQHEPEAAQVRVATVDGIGGRLGRVLREIAGHLLGDELPVGVLDLLSRRIEGRGSASAAVHEHDLVPSPARHLDVDGRETQFAYGVVVGNVQTLGPAVAVKFTVSGDPRDAAGDPVPQRSTVNGRLVLTEDVGVAFVPLHAVEA
jgi:hypothetical protein